MKDCESQTTVIQIHGRLRRQSLAVWFLICLSYIYTVSQKNYTTQPPSIILAIIVDDNSVKNKKHLKMLGPFATASRRMPPVLIAIHQMSLLSHAACASMSTTTSTTTTTRSRGDRYGPWNGRNRSSTGIWKGKGRCCDGNVRDWGGMRMNHIIA